MDTTAEKDRALLADVLDDLAGVVEGADGAPPSDPTPCDDMDVAALRTHVVGWLATFAGGFADPGGQTPRADLDGYAEPDDAAGEVRRAAAELDEGLAAGGAERPLVLGGAGMPGEMAVPMVLSEFVVHGWDLATATGQRWSPSADAVERSASFLPAMLTEDYQGEGKSFGPRIAVGEDAPALDRLLALTGRDPGWTAGS